MRSTPIPPIPVEQLKSIGDRLVRRDGHLVWTGSKLRKRKTDPYIGWVQVNKRRIYVHRIVWELYEGPADGLALIRTCDREMCVEPKHMRVKGA